MNEYQFTLVFALRDFNTDLDALVERLGAEGCTDALVGIGQRGRIGLDFTREALSAKEAIGSALADVKRAIPDADLVEAGPDFVGLTDIASFLGFSRQNMRKLAAQTEPDFPPPVHEGTPTLWHLSTVLDWLVDRGTYRIAENLREVARAAMHFNLAKELVKHKLETKIQQEVKRLLAA
jgi:hypothetical protein